jgi:hypothetical protein
MSCRDDDDDNVEGSFQTLLRRRKEEWAVGDNIQRSSNRVKRKPIRVIIKGMKHESTSLFYNLIDDIVIFFYRWS